MSTPMTTPIEALRIARGYIVDDIKRKPSEYDPAGDLKKIDEALASLEGDAVERVARIIAGPLCDATNGEHSIMAQGEYRFCTQCGETISKRTIGIVDARNKARAILATGLVAGEAAIRAKAFEEAAKICDVLGDKIMKKAEKAHDREDYSAYEQLECAASEYGRAAAAIRSGDVA